MTHCQLIAGILQELEAAEKYVGKRLMCITCVSELGEDLMTILSNISSLKAKHVRRRQRRSHPHVSVVGFIPFSCLWKMRNVVSARHVMCLRTTVPIHYASPQVVQNVSAAACGPAKKMHQINRGSQRSREDPAGEVHGIKSEGPQWWRCTGSTEETSMRNRSRECPAAGPSDQWRKRREEGREPKVDQQVEHPRVCASQLHTDVRFAVASAGVRAPSEFASFTSTGDPGHWKENWEGVTSPDQRGESRRSREDSAGGVDQIDRGWSHRSREGPARRMRRRTSRRGRDASDQQTEKGGGRGPRKSHNSSQ